MTQEEKAKAYDEAIKRAKDALNDGTISNNTIAYLQDIFSELKESEDERIRKDLIAFLEDIFYFGKNTNLDKWDKFDCSDWIVWLEKKREKKQDVKERAAIAALQGLLANPHSFYSSGTMKEDIVSTAMSCAYQLVNKLKEK